MTLQALEYFLAITRYHSFTKAAQECFVTQPALSRSIRELEEELGCSLFDRSSRSVQLTPAGEVLQAEARRIVDLSHQLPGKIQRFLHQEEAPLRVGYLIYDHLMAFVKALGQTTDGFSVPIDTRYYSCPEAKRRFLAHELDVLLLPNVCAADLPDVGTLTLYTSPIHAIVSPESPFFSRESISITELKDQSMIGWNPDELPLLQNAYAQACRSAGFEPRILDYGSKLGDIITKVLVHNAVGMISHIKPRSHSADVAYIPVLDARDDIGLACVWHLDDNAANLKLLLASLQHDNACR